MQTSCPPDNTLAAMIAGGLDEAQREDVRSHVDSCESCRSVMIAIARGTPAGQTPELAVTMVDVRRFRAELPARQRPVSLPPRYQIDRLLGEGGMGRVYAARDKELDRAVAVKVLRDEVATAGLAERLVRESRAMAQISHPGVVTVYDVGRHDGQVFIAMELVQGTTLQRWLAERPRGWREIVDVFYRAGEGLAAAHDAGLIHRDMKPENVLVAVDGERVTRVAVSDFGVALAARAETEAAAGPMEGDALRTGTGVAIGTPAYMAPEQLKGGIVDERADVFAFGVSLWEALYGARPYGGATIAALREAIARGAPVPPAQPAPGWIARTLQAAIDPDVAARPRSMKALLAALDPGRGDRRKRSAMIAIAGVVVTGSVAIAVVPRLLKHAPAPPALCTDAGIATAWDDAARARIRSAVVALPGEVAQGVAERAVQTGDAYAARWTEVRTAACKITDTARRDAMVACLDGRRSAVAKLVAIAPTLQRTDLADLDQVVGKLPSVTLCQTDAAVLVMRDLVPALRTRAAAVEARLAEAATLIAGGSLDKAREALAAMGAEVTAIGSRSLTAEHLFARASAAGEADVDAALALYREAALAADKAGRDDIAANSWLQLANEYANTKNDAGRARDALAQADAAITRGGEDGALRAHHALAVAQLAVFETKYDDAERLLAAARERIARDAPQMLADAEESQISLLTEAGKLDEAIAAARARIAERVKLRGETHASVITLHNILANALLLSGKLDDALAEAKLGAELAKRGYGADSDSYGLGLRNVSVLLEAIGKYDEALATLQQARAILVASRGPRNFMVGDTYQSEAVLLTTSGKAEQALPVYEQAIAIYKDSVGERHVRTAEAVLSYVGALSDLGRGKEAAAKARDAVALFKAVYGEDNPRYAYARAMYGEALIHANDKAAARIELEAAVAIYSHTEFIPTAKAAATFNLAEAIVDDPAQRARAFVLAKEALVIFEAAGEQWQPVVVNIKKWIASGGKEPK